jgi:hypothetical protein
MKVIGAVLLLVSVAIMGSIYWYWWNHDHLTSIQLLKMLWPRYVVLFLAYIFGRVFVEA